MKLFLASFFTLILSSLCADRLQILLPASLQSWTGSQYDSALKTEILPFGYAPWGRKILGWLVLPKSSDACDPIEFANQPKGENFIIIAQRQNCDLYVKAQNAEKAGAKMLIVVDSGDKGFKSVKIPPSSIKPINIPTLGVTKVVGEQIILDINIGLPEVSEILVLFDFSLKQERYKTYYLIMSSGNRESFKFFKEWFPYVSILGGKASLKPAYAFERIEGKEKECLCGRLCVPDGFKTVRASASEREIAEENLRQICMW